MRLNIKNLRKNKRTITISTKDSLKDIKAWFTDPFEEYSDNYTTNDEYENGDYKNNYEKDGIYYDDKSKS